jgi:hypothetical protein
MRFEIQKSTKRGIEYFERLGALYHEKGTTNKTLTPACTLYTSSGNQKSLLTTRFESFVYKIHNDLLFLYF